MAAPHDGKLAELGAEIPRLNLGVTLRQIRDGRAVETHRGDINALAGIFIEETWLLVEEWIQRHTSGLPVRSSQTGSSPDSYVTAPPEALLSKKNSDEIIETIRTNVLVFLDSHVEAWYRVRENRRQHPPADRSAAEAHLDHLYAVYYDAIVTGKQLSSATDPRYHVKSGLHTAVNTLLNFFKVLPQVYRDEFAPLAIDMAQARKLAEQSRRTMITLATMQISYFLALDGALKRAGADDYAPDKFRIVQEMGYSGRMNLRMEIRDEVLDAVKKGTRARPAPATGCPALVVQGGSGKSVIAAFYEWILQISEEQYFPYFDRQQTMAAPQAVVHA